MTEHDNKATHGVPTIAGMFAAARKHPHRIGAVVFFLAFSCWCGWFIFRTSFIVGGSRVFSLFDDAMISMTYARNLTEGYGLNWARHGSPVEGFSCPLWTFYMAFLHLLPIEAARQSLLVQLSGVAILAANLVAIHKLVRRHFCTSTAPYAWPATLLTASYYPLNHWTLQGMETGLQTLFVTLATLFALEIRIKDRRRETALMVLLSGAVLLRMDMFILVVVVFVFLVGGGHLSTKNWRRWSKGGAIFAVAVLGYESFRFAYFGDLLPNTYYLKMTGVPAIVRVLRGLTSLGGFLELMGPILIVVVVGTLPLFRYRPQLLLPAAFVLCQLAYSTYVGGDAWEWSNLAANRFQTVAVPLIFVLVNALMNYGLEFLDKIPRLEGHDRRIWHFYAVGPITLFCALTANGLLDETTASKRWRSIALIDRPLHVSDHQSVVEGIQGLSSWVAPDAKVAVVWAGTTAYHSPYRMVDILGYSDRRIARLRATKHVDLDNVQAFVPGHMKWDYDYTLGVHEPDIVFQPYLLTEDDVAQLFERHGYVRRHGVWAKKDSPHLR